MHHGIDFLAVVAAIGFAFGERTARVVVGAFLIGAGLACVYVGVLVITGAI